MHSRGIEPLGPVLRCARFRDARKFGLLDGLHGHGPRQRDVLVTRDDLEISIDQLAQLILQQSGSVVFAIGSGRMQRQSQPDNHFERSLLAREVAVQRPLRTFARSTMSLTSAFPKPRTKLGDRCGDDVRT